MKKNIILLMTAAVLVTSCGTYAGAGAGEGAYFGSILGSAIGGITGGPRGSDIGTLVGLAGGAIVGAAVGDAQDKTVRSDRQQYLEEKARLKANREARQKMSDYVDNSTQTDEVSSGYNAAGTADDRVDIDFGDASGNKTSGYQSQNVGTPSLQVRNVRFIDADGDGNLSRGETADIVFEIFNEGDGTAYNIEPTVVETTKNKHILISPTVLVESLAPHKGLRYTARVVADRMMKAGSINFNVSVRQNGAISSKAFDFSVVTIK